MMLIKLTKGYFAQIDDEDFEKISKLKWYAWTRDTDIYAHSKYKALYQMHRVIMNCPAGMVVDHIDGDGLNNQKSNLRICTVSDNLKNSKIRKDNTSGHKGVSWNKNRGLWEASINCNGRKFFLGRHANIEDAIHVRENKAEELFGEFNRKIETKPVLQPCV